MVIDMLWALIGGTVIGFLGKAAAPETGTTSPSGSLSSAASVVC